MEKRSLLLRLFACLAYFQLAGAVTKRTAYVSVRNDTPNPVAGVTVIHKYSNNYKHRGDWDVILPGHTSDTRLTVEYNTGAFTTGKDWWLVTLFNQDKTRFYYSDPKNWRWALDLVEGISAKDEVTSMFNSESSVGFKQHILRNEDAGEVTEIVINADNTITFRSNSGVSTTGISSTPVHGGKESSGPRPFWAVAHRVLDKQGVQAALNHGANAIETDATAWRKSNKGWWADHDGSATSRGDRMEELLTAVADGRRSGKPISWLWFDLKNPDNCGAEDEVCGIVALRAMARNILEPVGIRVLWGFAGSDAGGQAYSAIRDGLGANEALGIDGLAGTTAEYAKSTFQDGGPANVGQRVWTKGLFDPRIKFGSCEDADVDSTSTKICPQIRYGIESGAFGRVLGWTVTASTTREASRLMYAGVDGLIYGSVMTAYADNIGTRGAKKVLDDWLEGNKERRYLAKLDDKPW